MGLIFAPLYNDILSAEEDFLSPNYIGPSTDYIMNYNKGHLGPYIIRAYMPTQSDEIFDFKGEHF